MAAVSEKGVIDGRKNTDGYNIMTQAAIFII